MNMFMELLVYTYMLHFLDIGTNGSAAENRRIGSLFNMMEKYVLSRNNLCFSLNEVLGSVIEVSVCVWHEVCNSWEFFVKYSSQGLAEPFVKTSFCY